MTIYFDDRGEAYASEIRGYAAAIDDGTWALYCAYAKGTAWDVRDGRFVRLIGEDAVRAARDAEREISALKDLLRSTDYRAIKHAEGLLTDDEYADSKAEREAWRMRIRELEERLI